tara:strand:+ start:1588 stop:1734 length:147 start_codon:yes stop_codon:yes gene_type:complete
MSERGMSLMGERDDKGSSIRSWEGYREDKKQLFLFGVNLLSALSAKGR